MEGASRSGLALNPDASVHQPDERGRDREAEPRAAEPPGRRTIGLVEGFEDRRMLVDGDPDPRVAHRKMHVDRVPAPRLFPDRKNHLTLIGELDGIADE